MDSRLLSIEDIFSDLIQSPESVNRVVPPPATATHDLFYDQYIKPVVARDKDEGNAMEEAFSDVTYTHTKYAFIAGFKAGAALLAEALHGGATT